MIKTPSETSPVRSFEPHAKEMAIRVRQALSELAAASGIDISQPRGAARELDIDKTLAWKISKITAGSDPLAAMSMLPGTASQRTLLRAFSKAGAPADLINRARVALDEFQAMIEEHADDRETFEMMLSSVTHEGQHAREEAQRKLAFQGNSSIWGVHCRVRTWGYIISPSEDPELGDVGVLGSFVDVRRLRRDTRWTLATIAALEADGRPVAGNPIQPLMPGQTEFDGMPTLPEFCSGSLPPIERVRRPDGITHYQLMGGEVGNSGTFTWSVGWRYPRVLSRWRTAEDPVGEFALNVLIPAETAQLDLFVHKDFWPSISPESMVFSLLPGEPPVAHSAADRHAVPVHTSVQRLHQDPLDLTAHDVPNYARMFESAFASMGHKSSEFAGFRVRMKYPILSSSICMRFALPERSRS
jgi:hypothetical protein